MEISRTKDTITKTYTQVIDARPLKAELAMLEAEKAPTDKELIECAKAFHPHYQREDRIKELKEELGL